jgi:hypothetical protein
MAPPKRKRAETAKEDSDITRAIKKEPRVDHDKAPPVVQSDSPQDQGMDMIEDGHQSIPNAEVARGQPGTVSKSIRRYRSLAIFATNHSVMATAFSAKLQMDQ